MEQRSFLRQMQDRNGVWYPLPEATYVIENSDVTLTAAHDASTVPPQTEKPAMRYACGRL